ncbi:dynactin 6 [Anaeramoeba ignava]|uniref:Dynactin subunit 6 n=1 Tax=Anaeramoeba ignava TaxID=1746090 RepID=A0A9Q0LCS7_ANAIG|nr:dynactin 6 [Anaeramoeba ignava]
MSDKIICSKVWIEGDVSIGEGTIIHPDAELIAKDGPIKIGKNNIIEEKCIIINQKKNENDQVETLEINDYNYFEVGSYVESRKIGDNNIIGIFSNLGKNITLQNGVVINPKVDLSNESMILKTNTIAFQKPEIHFHEIPNQENFNHEQIVSHLERLRKLLPQFHELKEI